MPVTSTISLPRNAQFVLKAKVSRPIAASAMILANVTSVASSKAAIPVVLISALVASLGSNGTSSPAHALHVKPERVELLTASSCPKPAPRVMLNALETAGSAELPKPSAQVVLLAQGLTSKQRVASAARPVTVELKTKTLNLKTLGASQSAGQVAVLATQTHLIFV